VLFIVCIQAFGTAQTPDILIYKGDTLPLFDCPLNYIQDRSISNPWNLFGSSGCYISSCWRNYVATWEIVDDKLYLTSIRNACYGIGGSSVAISYPNGYDNIGTEYADLEKLFPGKSQDGRVLADWVNAKMISPEGKTLYHINDGFLSIYEKETEFTIENGVLTGIREYDNSKTKISKFTKEPQLIAEYIKANIDYTNLPETDDTVIVYVAIRGADDAGKINDADVIRGYNEAYDNEALRVVKSIPEWDVLYRHGARTTGPLWSIKVIFDRKMHIEEELNSF